ncbi:MAG: hypothetical protein JKY52_01225, partial [Flavobacteriales bacterium]|nr:hypothetical protein [Flavobacteriales bacterium]
MPFSAIFDLMEMLLEKALIASVFALQFLFFLPCSVMAQCPPTITLSSASASITIDDFSDVTAGVTRNGITNIGINTACTWDLFASATLTLTVPYSAQGVALSLSEIDIRAVNLCFTPDHDYGGGSPPPPPRINSTILGAAFVPPPSYIVGTALVEGGALVKAPGPCAGTTINGVGTATANPTTHNFRIDIRVTPGISPVITPGIYDLAIDFSDRRFFLS